MDISEKLEKIQKEKKERIEKIKRDKNEALYFVGNFKDKYISIRIRDGYIGKELDGSGRKLQTERSKPRGTFVAIKGDNGKVYIGSSYLSKKDFDIPIVGIENALKVALKNKLYDTDEVRTKNRNDKDLLNFFRIRACCYFYPELYSHSRGKEPLKYPNYSLIHENRKRVLG